MFTITTKTNYALSAISELIDSYDKNLLQIRDIVARQNVPKNYLEQILNRLAKAGIVRSLRGNKGGYMLAQPPEAITVLQVIECLEGEFALSRAAGFEALSELLDTVEKDIKTALSISVAELSTRQKAHTKTFMYNI